MGISNMRYTPILKAKAAEIGALLTAPRPLILEPLFELQKAPTPITNPAGKTKRAKSTITDASYFLDDVARLWHGPLYVDISRVAPPAARQTWWGLLAAMVALHSLPAPRNTTSRPSGLPPLMPVIHESDPRPARQAASILAGISGRAALRIRMPHASPGILRRLLVDTAHDLGLSPSKIDVVLDWGEHLEPDVVLLDDLVTQTEAVMNTMGNRGHLITAGTPNSDDFVQTGDWHVTRREWWLWLRLAHAGYETTFGDYVLYPPADPVPVAPRYGHLRYSSGDELHVHRRSVPRSGGGLSGAFRLACQHLVAQQYFRGASYSPADQEFADSASGAKQVKMPGKWRELAAIHHFALVAEQLASPPQAPPAGTK